MKAWWKAFRPLSLVIAAISCGFGILKALTDAPRYGISIETPLFIIKCFAVFIAGILIQGGVNLANDFFEFKRHPEDDKFTSPRVFRKTRDALEWIIFFSALACFAAAAAIGLFLVITTGWELLVLGAVGLAGGYFYTGEPFNYKRRGLGVLFVFFLMGPLMIAGSYFALTRRLTLEIVLLSIPLGLLISNVLLANELRDFERDSALGLRTLTVRIGYKAASSLFTGLFCLTYVLSAVFMVLGTYPFFPFIFLAVLSAIPSLRIAFRKGGPSAARLTAASGKGGIIPWMMIHHIIFGIVYCVPFFVIFLNRIALEKI